MIETTRILPCRRGVAEELVNYYHLGDFKHHRLEEWYVWKGQRWEKDRKGAEVCKILGRTFRQYLQRAVLDEDLYKFAVQLFNSPKKALEHVATMRAIECEGAVFDECRFLLNTPTATIDLRDKIGWKHNRRDMLSKMAPTPHDPAAQCPEFHRFLDTIFVGDKELIAYAQRILGYTITGETGEQLLWLWYGPKGQNGKSTLANIIRGILGTDYAMDADAPTITGTARSIPSDVARLKDARCLFVREPKRGAALNEPRIKSLTGDDEIVARYLFKEFFEFRPNFKLHMVTNHLPPVPANDPALWRGNGGREVKHFAAPFRAVEN